MFKYTGKNGRSQANAKYNTLDATKWLFVELLDEKSEYRVFAIVSDLNFIPCLHGRKYIALS